MISVGIFCLIQMTFHLFLMELAYLNILTKEESHTHPVCVHKETNITHVLSVKVIMVRSYYYWWSFLYEQGPVEDLQQQSTPTQNKQNKLAIRLNRQIHFIMKMHVLPMFFNRKETLLKSLPCKTDRKKANWRMNVCHCTDKHFPLNGSKRRNTSTSRLHKYCPLNGSKRNFMSTSKLHKHSLNGSKKKKVTDLLAQYTGQHKICSITR